MCYLKTHYPLYFYQALLNFNIGSDVKTKEYLDCIKKLNIEILKPDVNLSTNKYQIIDNKLLLPFNIVKNIGSNVTDIIVNVRNGKFHDYFDFVKKVNVNSIGKKTIEVLINAGALDTFGINRRTMIENLDDAITYSELSSGISEMLVSVPNLKEYSEYSNDELMNLEKELYGFYLSNHPVVKYNNEIKLIDLKKYFDKYIILYVYVENIRKIKTKKNEDMAFLSCSDETSQEDFILFPNKINYLNDIKKGDVIYIAGHVEKRLDKYQVIISSIK